MASEGTSLQEELRQSKPFRSPAHEATVAILKTADVLDRHFMEITQSYGLTPSQYNVLRILRGAGEEGLCTLEVADRLIRRSPGISRMMDRLERKEWVSRERSAQDRREVRCYITRKGRELIDGLDQVVDNADRDAALGLSPDQQRELITLLERVRASHP